MKAQSLLLAVLVPVAALTFQSLPAGAQCWITCPPGSTAAPNATGTKGATATAEPAASPKKPAKKPEATEATSGTPTRTSQAADAPMPLATSGSTGYKIGPGDVVDISVFNVPALSQAAEVSSTGTINLPLLGEVPAAGKSAPELQRDLTWLLGAKYLQNPQVTVSVKNYNSQRVTMTGDIAKPGVYPLKDNTTLLALIADAGGLKQSTDWTVLVLRETNGKRSAATFDVDEIQKGRAADPTLQAGDTVVAGSSAIKRGYQTVLKVLPLAGLFAFVP
jgi:polysaccharide biosynthesis/export protein